MLGIESRKKTYVEAVVDIDPDGRPATAGDLLGRRTMLCRGSRARIEARGEHEGRAATGSAIPLRSAEGQSTFGIATTADGT